MDHFILEYKNTERTIHKRRSQDSAKYINGNRIVARYIRYRLGLV